MPKRNHRLRSFPLLFQSLLLVLPFVLAPNDAQSLVPMEAQSDAQGDATSPAPWRASYQYGPQNCSAEMEYWDIGMQMCMPLAMEGMSMRMLMLHGQVFGGGTVEQGLRGRNALWSTSMVMADLGTTLGSSHYLNLDFMGTAELWTVPSRGYPELLQIGEQDAQGRPFIDAQHPHSSPIMGLTLSDTIRFSQNSQNNLKIFFAPRGETTDGPIAFMHRPTGIFNPDAPLGHHIGQDVGHISSTVLGASLKMDQYRIEASAFHGAEPSPDEVDLPLGVPDSFSVRLIQEFSPIFTAMVSVAYVNQPEPEDPDTPFVMRYSGSLYHNVPLNEDWMFHHALIFGGISEYDHASFLSSFGMEWLFHGRAPRIWGRLEVLQRTAAELQIPVGGDPNLGQWVTALTLGYTHKLASIERAELGLGGSITKDFLPGDFIGAYGGNPWTAKLFLRLGGIGMWNI